MGGKGPTEPMFTIGAEVTLIVKPPRAPAIHFLSFFTSIFYWLARSICHQKIWQKNVQVLPWNHFINQ